MRYFTPLKTPDVSVYIPLCLVGEDYTALEAVVANKWKLTEELIRGFEFPIVAIMETNFAEGLTRDVSEDFANEVYHISIRYGVEIDGENTLALLERFGLEPIAEGKGRFSARMWLTTKSSPSQKAAA